MGRSAPGGTFWGATKLRLYLKTENRKDTKKRSSKNWGVKNSLGGGIKIFRGTKNFLGVENEEKKGGCAKKNSGLTGKKTSRGSKFKTRPGRQAP